jgi:hypothetical protein
LKSVIELIFWGRGEQNAKKYFNNNHHSISGQTFDVSTFDRTSVQRLDNYDEQYTFDFLDFITKAFPDADKRSLMEQLEKTVLYKAHTAEFIEKYEINTYCGLSCYISHIYRNDLNSYYQQLDWYQADGYNKLF